MQWVPAAGIVLLMPVSACNVKIQEEFVLQCGYEGLLSELESYLSLQLLQHENHFPHWESTTDYFYWAQSEQGGSARELSRSVAVVQHFLGFDQMILFAVHPTKQPSVFYCLQPVDWVELHTNFGLHQMILKCSKSDWQLVLLKLAGLSELPVCQRRKRFGLFSELDTVVGIWAQNVFFLLCQLVCFGCSLDKPRSGLVVVVSFGKFEPLMFGAKDVEGHGLEAAELGYPN